jgi:HEAT repeat protein
MDKLVERETATRNPLVAAPALAVQFFLIPLAVVGIAVLLYSGFRSLLADDRTPQDYLAEVRSGGNNRRWPAAYELSRLMGDATVRADRTLAPALIAAYDEAKDDDPRIRQYLALAIGRLDPPLPAAAVASLTKALDDPDGEARIMAIWALGSSSDPQVAAALLPLYDSSDKGIRKMVVYALGALPGEMQLKTLQTALQDSEADVRWNAAVALARHDRRDGVPVLQQMLDRAYVEQAVKRDVAQNDDLDPVADVIISGLRAAAVLRDDRLRPSVEGLSLQDRSMKVRQAALEALKEMATASN